MHAAALRVELLLREARSLKEKRNRLKSVAGQLSARFPVAVAEIDHQNLWKRATLGIAIVAAQPGQLERLLHSIRRWLEAQPEMEVLEIATSYMAED